MSAPESPRFGALLVQAIREPGTVSKAYSLFHSYSMGNAMAAWSQCLDRKIEPGPIATFKRWKELGRHVRKGSKAIVLCMPVTAKRTEEKDGEKQEHCFTRFIWRPNWFVLSQTDGEGQADALAMPGWDATKALETLSISQVPFTALDGNCQGFASKRTVSVSPVAYNPVRTLVHEIAHVVLGHTAVSDCEDTPDLSRAEREVEAEGTAYLVGSVLNMPGLEHSRGYLQHWLGSADVPERTAMRIFKAADTILKAGRS